MAMDDKKWRAAHALAAELIEIHNLDANELQKTISYLMNEQPPFDRFSYWLDAKLDYASLYPRSNQTVQHDLTMRQAVRFIHAVFGDEDPADLAEMLGWIVRLMAYYKRSRSRAQGIVKRNKRLLKVPSAESIPREPVAPLPPLRVRFEARQRPDTLVDPAPDKPSYIAQSIMDILKKRGEDE